VSETLLDELACCRLVAVWAHRVDRHDIDGVIALFTEDGVLHSRTGGDDAVGAAAIRAFFANHHDANRVTRHVTSPPFIELTGADDAQGITGYVLYEGFKGSTPEGAPLPLTTPLAVGEFHQRYRRTPEGWRIASHRSVSVFRRA
jgi:ketosteroid isomerase-like protein